MNKRGKLGKRPQQVLMYGIASKLLIPCRLNFCSPCFPSSTVNRIPLCTSSSVSLVVWFPCDSQWFVLLCSCVTSFCLPYRVLASPCLCSPHLMSAGLLCCAERSCRVPHRVDSGCQWREGWGRPEDVCFQFRAEYQAENARLLSRNCCMHQDSHVTY